VTRFIGRFVVYPFPRSLIPLFANWAALRLISEAGRPALAGTCGLRTVYLFTDSPALTLCANGWLGFQGGHHVGIDISRLVALAVNVVGLAALLFSVRYLDHYTGRWKFYSLFMLILAGLNGVTITGDMFNMFVFIEIAAVSSYALVAFGTDFDELEAGFKYMVIGEVGGTAILLAIALLYAKASTLNMAVVSQVMAGFGHTHLFWFIVATFLVGFAVPRWQCSFHAWLPMAAPVRAPASLYRP